MKKSIGIGENAEVYEIENWILGVKNILMEYGFAHKMDKINGEAIIQTYKNNNHLISLNYVVEFKKRIFYKSEGCHTSPYACFVELRNNRGPFDEGMLGLEKELCDLDVREVL